MNEKIKKVILPVLSVIALILGYYFLNRIFALKIPCIFHKITNLYCPGCGITRCLFAVLQGDFKKAFRYNQLFFIIFPFWLIYYLYSTYLFIVNKENIVFSKVYNVIWIVLLIIAIIFGILRNLSFFDFLRP